MNQRSSALRIANGLRAGRRVALSLVNGTRMNLRALLPRSTKADTVIVLSLGNLGRSAEVARQAFVQGHRVHVFCKDYPTQEARFAHGWTRLDCRTEFDRALETARRLDPVAILLESKNLLLPMQNHLATSLDLVAVGESAALSSNSKIALREALDRAALPNLPWAPLEHVDTANITYPAVIKPDLGTASKGVRYVANRDDIDDDTEYRAEIQADESVGERMMVESYVAGRQFDVEGIASDGRYHPLTVVEEYYEAAPPYFPPVWFHFNPPISAAMRATLIEATEKALQALGVKNGAWHLEQRLDASGTVRILDYANRQGYNLLVSAASGVSFAGEYVSCMSGAPYAAPALRPRSLLQLFAFEPATLSRMKRLVSDEPGLIHSSSFFPYEFSYHLYLGYVVIEAPSYEALHDILLRHDLVPPQFDTYYSRGALARSRQPAMDAQVNREEEDVTGRGSE